MESRARWEDLTSTGSSLGVDGWTFRNRQQQPSAKQMHAAQKYLEIQQARRSTRESFYLGVSADSNTSIQGMVKHSTYRRSPRVVQLHPLAQASIRQRTEMGFN